MTDLLLGMRCNILMQDENESEAYNELSILCLDLYKCSEVEELNLILQTITRFASAFPSRYTELFYECGYIDAILSHIQNLVRKATALVGTEGTPNQERQLRGAEEEEKVLNEGPPTIHFEDERFTFSDRRMRSQATTGRNHNNV